MNIGINVEYINQKYGGVGYFTYELLNQFSKYGKKYNFYLISYFDHKEINDFTKKNKNFHKLIIPYKNKKQFYKNFYKNKLFYKIKLDILHMLHFEIPSKKYIKKYNPNLKIIVTIHDLIQTYFVKLENIFTLKSPLKTISGDGFINIIKNKIKIKNADFITGVSDYTTNDIIREFNIDKNKVKTILNGVNPNFKPAKDIVILRKYNLTYKKYFIYFGGHAVRKNVYKLYKSYIKMNKDIIDNYKLVIVGTGYFEKKIHKHFKKNYPDNNNIIFTGRISQKELISLVGGSYLSYYISLFEGFGFPVLESFKAKVPCISSNNSSIKEVCPFDELSVNPYDINDIISKTYKLVFNKNLYKKIVNKIFDFSKKFTWEKSAKQYLELYQKVKDS